MKGEGDLLISIYSRHWFPHRLITYTWDHRGNLLADGAFTYTYSAAGRMVRAESLTATLVYTYNADGLRVAQAQSVATVESVDLFTWDWAAGVPELLSDGDSLYLIGYDTLGWQRGDDWTFVLPDALGSVRQETDGAGAVIAVREWTPYGEEIGGTQAGLGFTGEWFDTGVGLQYLRARWLDVGTGRFTSMDPWAGDRRQSLTLNPYLYVVANPLNAVDPSGWYHKDVHLELTKRLVLELGSGWPDAEKLAETIAEANQHVDDFGSILNSLFCRECHFCDKTRTDIHINEAINRSNPYLFGAALHQFQDFYSHWNEGFERSHGWETVRAGVNLSGSPRSPGGKSHRLELLTRFRLVLATFAGLLVSGYWFYRDRLRPPSLGSGVRLPARVPWAFKRPKHPDNSLVRGARLRLGGRFARDDDSVAYVLISIERARSCGRWPRGPSPVPDVARSDDCARG